ncbi:hypothetical protein SETIT_2G015600v2 [Setaria italica]|uniref:F-box domain-containing protein n=1 Tax=Setaria italica TaxID=4555 RepID=K3ZUB1_SETIT|nr:uncharacterized protein LOC101759248 [Setaria italica]RCV09288.1 hypothetical protein SETIT_2G015600v2 [Setaria italica]
MAEALTDDLVEEILVRLAPDDPVSLLRAAAVCRRWCRVVSAPVFRRRFALRHRAPPMLGFLANLRDGDDDDGYDYVTRFVPATPFRPRHAERRDRRALDARHGRVLLATMPCGPDLEVWDPVTGGLRKLPALPVRSPFSWNAAVVCAAHGSCTHLDCRRGPFLVVFLESDLPDKMRVYVYSSEAGAWSGPIYGPPSPSYGIELVPTSLVGNGLHFLIDATNSILKYDLTMRSVSESEVPLAMRNPSEIPLPPGFHSDFAVLTTLEDGVLGFARVENYRLWLWSMETSPEGDAIWVQKGSIELETLLGVDASSIQNDYVGFAHGVGVFFVGTEDAWFSIDLKSGQVREEDCGDGDTFGVVPYTSFYTPDLHQYGLAPL